MAKSTLEVAQEYDALGWNLVPAAHRSKTPSVDWKKFQSQRTSDKLRAWFAGGERNIFIVTGELSRLVVVDCDSIEAEEWWRERLGPVLDATAIVRTSKGRQFYFQVPPGVTCPPNASRHEGDLQWDIRGEGGGVIAPPSIHPTGAPYIWMQGPEHIQPMPESLPEAIAAGKARIDGEAPQARSMLSKLLANPPKGEGGRNEWLVRVLGHYAVTHRRMRDLYEVEAQRAADMLTPPLPEDEVRKTLESVWKTEQAKGADPDDVAECGPATGWLVRGNYEVLVQVRIKEGDESRLALESFGDFDIRAVGVVEDEEANRTYDCIVLRKRRQDERRALLPAGVLADARRMTAWLAELGVGVLAPDGVWPRSGTWNERLRRYIEAQDPPRFQVVPHLGWHGDGFVCHEGVITADGLTGHGSVRPDPKLINWAPYRYGFDSEALDVLREVLTFHHPQVAAVFGSWWATTFLKPQVMEASALFPFMALEAPSESGKSTGMFSMLLSLSGNTKGQSLMTKASMRDAVSAHQSGIVWIDDADSIDHLTEILRAATGEGTVTKKGEDRTGQVDAQLVAPIVVSGESLGLGDQKALLDRAVALEVPSPIHRRSLRDGGRPQWDDIVALRRRHPDLTAFAGTLTQEFLQRVSLVGDLPNLKPSDGGRWGDKIAVVRLGAQLLEAVTGLDWIAPEVEGWIEDQFNGGAENALTLKLIPTALAQTEWQHTPQPPSGRWPMTPVLYRNRLVWFSPQLLARWWRVFTNDRVVERTESEEALIQQARALGLGGEKGTGRKMFKSNEGKGHNYWKVGEELSTALLGRSRGEWSGPGQGSGTPVGPTQARLDLWAARRPERVEEPEEGDEEA